MTKRIFKGIFLVSFLTMLACIILIAGVTYEYFGGRLKADLESKAEFAAQGVEKSGIDYFDDLEPVEDRITWIAEDGTVIYDNKADVLSMENHSGREEFVEALETGSGEAARYSSTLAEKTYYYALRLDDDTVIRVSDTQHTLWVLLLGILEPILLVLIFSILISALLASKMAKRIVKPINNIDLENPDIDESYDELSPLLGKISKQNEYISEQMDELRRKQDEFAIITENMSEGFLIVDKKTDILSYNQSALKLLSASVTENNKSVLSLNRSESFRLAVTRALKGEHNEQPLSINGRFYHVIANPVFDNGEVSGVIIVILDVTEKEMREQLRREFTSNVSHELKTPLTSIYGVSDMLLAGMVKPEDTAGFIKDIHDEAGRLIALVNDIIKLSQLDEDAVPAQKEPVDLYELAKAVMSRLENSAAENNISFELLGGHAVISGIPAMLDEMLYNLCDNAVKYNKPGGKVKVSASEDAGHITLSVEDTGIGIPASHLDRVFERFYRVDKSHSKKIGGTGLGLSIVKHTAAYHGGTVKIQSAEGIGTKITIEFTV